MPTIGVIYSHLNMFFLASSIIASSIISFLL